MNAGEALPGLRPAWRPARASTVMKTMVKRSGRRFHNQDARMCSRSSEADAVSDDELGAQAIGVLPDGLHGTWRHTHDALERPVERGLGPVSKAHRHL